MDLSPSNPDPDSKKSSPNFWSGFLRYLSGAERSPVSAERWLERRELSDAQRAELFSRAQNENYLSPRRYAELFLLRAQENGNKPLWILRKLLESRGISKKYFEDLPFDEALALRRFVSRKYRGKINPEGLKKLQERLRMRGFSGTLARKVLEELMADPGKDDH